MTPEDAPQIVAEDAWDGATWLGPAPERPPAPGIAGQALGVARLLGFVLLTATMLPAYLAARPLGAKHGVARLWCRVGLWLCGLRLEVVGAPVAARPGRGAVLLCNHASWLDILAVGATAPIHFVAKADIAGWPVFGWLGKLAGTLFIERRRGDAKAQELRLADRVAAGQTLCVFPEGTSSDGLRVLPFKSSLFAVFFVEGRAPWAQPATLRYTPPPGLPASFYGLWGRTPLADHLWRVICLSRGGALRVTFHPPLDPAAFTSRKELAAKAQAVVAASLLDRA